MLLMTPAEAAQTIGAKCGGASPDSSDPLLLEVLKYITGKIEVVLNVSSLTQNTWTESVYLTPLPAYWRGQREIAIRLANGFVSPDTVFVFDSNGDEIEEDHYKRIDNEKGIVCVEGDALVGKYTIEYVAGFPRANPPDNPPDDFDYDALVLQNVPAWMRGLVALYLVQWFRVAKLNPNAPKDVSYRAVIDALDRSIYTQAYGKYQRPRQNCVFTDPC